MKYFIFLIFMSLFLSCQQEKKVERSSLIQTDSTASHLVLTEEQLKAIEITVSAVEKKPLASTLQLNGKVVVNPNLKVSLSSILGGHITSINALPGKWVNKGEVVITLEDQQFIQLQQDYLTTKAELLSAAPNYERQKLLNQSMASSDKVAQQAETLYKSLLAIKRGLEEKLMMVHINPSNLSADNMKRTVSIVAPFSGIISKVLVNKGRYVSSSEVLVELINPEGLLLNMAVFEKDVSKIKLGQWIEAYTNENPENKIQAKVISKGVDINEFGNTEIIAQVTENRKVDLFPGLYINALIKLQDTDRYTIPANAVVHFEGENYIFVVLRNNHFRFQKIDLGAMENDLVEVENPSDLLHKKIVNNGAYALLMALKNKPEE